MPSRIDLDALSTTAEFRQLWQWDDRMTMRVTSVRAGPSVFEKSGLSNDPLGRSSQSVTIQVETPRHMRLDTQPQLGPQLGPQEVAMPDNTTIKEGLHN